MVSVILLKPPILFLRITDMAENIDLQNEELQNALQIIQYTHRSLSLPERRERVNLHSYAISQQTQRKSTWC